MTVELPRTSEIAGFYLQEWWWWEYDWRNSHKKKQKAVKALCGKYGHSREKRFEDPVGGEEMFLFPGRVFYCICVFRCFPCYPRKIGADEGLA